MSRNKEEREKEEIPVLSLIQRIKEGKLDPRTLDKKSRQECVELFWLDGNSIATIAQLLKRSSKTIKRDINDLSKRFGIGLDQDKLVGEFLARSRSHVDHLMRLARTKDASVGERAQAEYYAAQTGSNAITKLQSLGYLPSVPKNGAGDQFHQKSVDVSYPVIQILPMANKLGTENQNDQKSN